jgi:hypothetical protein
MFLPSQSTVLFLSCWLSRCLCLLWVFCFLFFFLIINFALIRPWVAPTSAPACCYLLDFHYPGKCITDFLHNDCEISFTAAHSTHTVAFFCRCFSSCVNTLPASCFICIHSNNRTLHLRWRLQANIRLPYYKLRFLPKFQGLKLTCWPGPASAPLIMAEYGL